jgi:endonuclease YncB( thermonuclease family)
MLALLIAGCVLRLGWPAISRDRAGSLPRETLSAGPCEIAQVMDGRTLLVRQGDVDHTFAVRLLGVALPASEADRLVAAKELEKIAPLGHALIELDKRRLADDGTWLAYVYVESVLLNAEILGAGAAKHDLYPGDSPSIAQTLKAAQSEANRNGRGIW